jgi:hypothetical protein
MSVALQQAYASAEQTPVYTIRLLHTGLTAGARSFVQGKYDLTATLETAAVVTFQKTGMAINLPQKGVNGRQDISFQLSNVSREAWNEIKAVIASNRAQVIAGNEPEKIILEFRQFLESDLSAPSGPVYKMIVMNSSVDLMTLSITASFMPIADMSWPKFRYYAETYPGVRYA